MVKYGAFCYLLDAFCEMWHNFKLQNPCMNFHHEWAVIYV